MDELERLLWKWRADLCRCWGVSEGVHKIACPVDKIADGELLDYLYNLVLDWHDDEVDNEIAEELERAKNPPSPPTALVDDPE